MIVVDASAMVEGLVGRDPDDELLDVLAGDLSAPHLLDLEVVSVVRGLLLAGKLAPAVADDARRDYFAFRIERHELEPLAERVWALRFQITADHAAYLALAEALGCPLWTCDATLATAGHGADVRVLARSR